MAAENKDIRYIVNRPDFRDSMTGCCIAKAHSIVDSSIDANELAWAFKLLNDNSVLSEKSSTMVNAVAQLVVKTEMLLNPAKEPVNIVTLSEADITTHINTHMAFIADNQPS